MKFSRIYFFSKTNKPATDFDWIAKYIADNGNVIEVGGTTTKWYTVNGKGCYYTLKEAKEAAISG